MNYIDTKHLFHPEHLCMVAATIHSGNPSMTVKDSVRTAADLIHEVDRVCREEVQKARERENLELASLPAQQQQQRQI